MKCICVTGAIQHDLDLVFNILQQAGIKSSQPNKRNELIDMSAWHEQALTLDGDFLAENTATFNPGRFMEQMASDIFIANIKTDIWGWADTRSALLLDYWVNFDPRIQFVIVYISPQQMLANVMSTTTETLSVDAIMSAWQTYYQQLLRFYLRNPQRSILVDAQESMQNPQALLKHCAEQWSWSTSSLPKNLLPIDMPQDSLALYIAQQLSDNYPDVISLQHEIAATLTRLSENKAIAPTMTGESLIKSYRALQDRSLELSKIQRAYEELAIVKAEFSDTITAYQQQEQEIEHINQLLVAQLEQVEEELKSYFLKNEAGQKQVDDLTSQLTTLAHAYQQQSHLATGTQAQQQSAQQENELLLLQLHQVQEELETYFLKSEAGQKQVDDLSSQLTTLAHAYQQQNHLATERQEQIEQLTQEQANVLAAHTKQQQETQAQQQSAQQENELLLLQLHQVQEELETYFLKSEAGQKQVDDLSSQLTTLAHAYQQQNHLATERQEQIEQLTQEQANVLAAHTKQQQETQAQQQSAQQENELLLLQLHQVQEELEHYFLQHQDAQQQLQQSEKRWQHMLQRTPDYCDYEALDVLPVEDESNSSIWQIKNLTIAGRQLPQLTFKLILEQGIAGFVFTKPADNKGPFIRWTANVKTEKELVLIPVGKDELVRQRIESLLELSVSDWDLLKALCGFIEETLKQPQTVNLPKELDLDALVIGLNTLKNVFEKFPALIRYDQLSIKREQINPDYEHLWLHITQLAYGNKRWPEFEFRLSCANVRPNHFGAHPKLEFPEITSQNVLESWFIEAYDDFGAKLELRFAMPAAMDLEVWQRFSEVDKNFLVALIARLPNMLTDLQSAGVKIKRPWQDWIDMSQAMLTILTPHIAAPIMARQEEPVVEKPKLTDAFKAKVALTSEPKSGQSNKIAKNR